MNPADLIIGILVAFLLLGAVFLAVRRRRKGSSCCSGGCGACRLCEADGGKKKNGPSHGDRASGDSSERGMT